MLATSSGLVVVARHPLMLYYVAQRVLIALPVACAFFWKPGQGRALGASLGLGVAVVKPGPDAQEGNRLLASEPCPIPLSPQMTLITMRPQRRGWGPPPA